MSPPGQRSGPPRKTGRHQNSAAAKQLVPPQGDTTPPEDDRTHTEAVSRTPWTAYERRAVLAARTQLRWRTLGIFWPRDAQSVAEADIQWLVEVLALTFSAAVTAARELERTPAAA
jgi:hypothetical protein